MSEFKIDLTLTSAKGKKSPSTTASLSMSVGDYRIWPTDGVLNKGLEIQVDDLLSYLSECWKPLMLRQTYPTAIQVDRPSLLRPTAERRWEDKPSLVVEREDEQISNFEEAHNVSLSFAGYFDLPPIWLFRSDDKFIIETHQKVHSASYQQVRNELSRVGDQISAHLSPATAKWKSLIDSWTSRDSGSPVVLLAWSTSLDRGVAERFAAAGILTPPRTVTEAANDHDELMIAARMASALPPTQIEQIIDLVRRLPAKESPALDKLGKDVTSHIDAKFALHRAHEQGEEAAIFVREYLSLAPSEYFDIFDLMLEFGVTLEQRDVEPTTLDALAIWGLKHGPAVLLNSNSFRASKKHGSRNWAARVTLAHEFCHLLLDRGHALSAVDVLHSRMPQSVERRAKSFAGELLLPANAAINVWEEAKSPRSPIQLEKVVRTLQATFGVTRSVATWKLDHALQRRDIDLSLILDAIAPFR